MIINDFRRFFIGRPDAYIYQYDNGEWTQKKETITDYIIQEHLDHKITIGSYPYYESEGHWYCKWECIDLDMHSEENLDVIRDELEPISLKVLMAFQNDFSINKNDICREYSGGGYHIWIKNYPNTPLERAHDFKSAIEKWLWEKFKIKSTEGVNPKQRTIEKNGYGNAVKLPLSLNRKRNVICDILDKFDLSQQGEGYKIPDWIPRINEDDKSIITKEKKTEMNDFKVEIKDENFSYFINKLRPCFQKVALDGSLTHKQEGKNGHQMNLYLCGALIYEGASDDMIHKFYQTHPTYNYTKTQYQINGARKSFKKEYVENLSCKKIQQIGFCFPECPNFDTDKGERKYRKYKCSNEQCDYDILTTGKPGNCKQCGGKLRRDLINYLQVTAWIVEESPQALLILTPNAQKEWFPKSIIYPKYSNDKTQLQTFLIESWIVKKKFGD